MAAFWGRLDIMESLIQAGANIGRVDKYGESPLDVADTSGESAVAAYLSSKGATYALSPGERAERRSFIEKVRRAKGEKLWVHRVRAN